MTGLKQYNRVMGVDENRAKLAQTAVVQMAGKGKITAEELFGQLAESSPGAVNVLSRSMGLSVGQLRKEMESGSLNANDALPRFGNQLAAESLGSVDKASESGAASVGRLQNSFASLQAAIGDKIMAPTIIGLNTATEAANTLKNNIDTLGKVFAAALLSAAASAVGLAGGLGLANPVLGFLIKRLISALPLLKTFALQTAIAYAAIEVFNTVMGSINDSSPFKSLADESEAAFAKISKGADQTAQDINKLKDEIYGKDRSVFQVIGDGISGAFGGQTSITKKAADDTVNADRILNQNENALKRKPPELTEANRNRRNDIDLELSVIRSQNANLTSKDRDKIDLNNKREQQLIQERLTLEKPINTRQAELEQVVKNTNNIIDSPLRNSTEKALAATQLAEAEKEQRKLQQQLVSSASTLAIGLRGIGEGLQAGLAAIDLASINRKTQTYLAATQDVRNTGAFTSANFADSNTNLSAKQSLQQQAVSTLKSTIYSPENRSTVKALGVDPENVSQEQIDRLKSTVTDTRGQSLLGYLSKYQQVKTELAQTNQSLFEGQYSYIKSIADYNKQLTDKVISLDNKLVNLQISARNSINSLQQAIEEQLIEIDRTSGKAMLQAQKNRMQTAYNKFLDKLGISTDDIFEQIFQNYSSIIDSLGQMSDRRLNTKQSGVTAKYREKTNESRKTQVQTEQSQSNSEARRQSNEEKLTNPLNQPQPPNPETPPATSGEKSNLISPVESSKSSGFGWRKHPVTGERKFHEGVDYLVPVGTSIKAAGDGIVTFAGNKSGYGYTIDLKHPSGETTRYAHASKIGIAVGQQIKQGEQIGLSGGAKGHPGSGTSTGGHLHFEIRNSKGVAVDPLKRLKQNSNIQTPVSTNSTLENTSLASTQENINTEPAGSKLPQGEIFKMDSFTTPAKSSAPPKEVSGGLDYYRKKYPKPVSGPEYQPYTPTSTTKSVPSVQPIPKIKAVPKVQPLPQLSTNSYTNVVSSFYTPGEGGAINGAKVDIRGKYIDSNSFVMATRTTASPQGIPYGAKVELRNPDNGKTVIVTNVDRGTLRPGRDIDLTPAPARRLGVTPDGLANLQMRVISVPKGQQLKDSYDLGGGIGSYDRKGNYTGKSGTIVKNKEIQDSTVEPKLEEQKKLNEFADRKKEELLKANEETSKVYVADTKRYSDIDTSNTKKKLAQERNLANQQDQGDLLNVDTKILQNRNLINRNVPIFNRKTVQIQRDASAYNRSADRTPYQQLDKLTQQYGGTPDTTTLDTSITTAQSTFDRIKEDSRTRRENILKQIQSIEAKGAGLAELRKTNIPKIKELRKRGDNVEADKIQQILEDNDRAFGTPQARQKMIDGLSDQYRRLPSDGIASYNAIAPGTAKVLTDYQTLNQEYQPKTFNDNLQAQGRSIVQRFKSIKDTIQTEYNTLGEAAMQLEAEIQAKLKAAGYAPQLIDVKDPERLKLLEKVAPEETKRLVSAVGNRDKLGVSSKQVDVDAETAAARTVSIAKQREQINVDRTNTDYLESTQGRDISARIQIDKQKFNIGKTELDLQLNDGSIGIDLYNAKLNQLTLETNTLRNAMLPLREASSNFFQDIFKGKSILEGIGDAFRNLAIGILTNLQNLISQKLGEQLFGTLLKGAEGIQDSANGKKTGNMLLDQLAPVVAQALGFRSPGAKSNTNNGMDISLNQSPLEEESYPLQYDVPPSRRYSSPRGMQIPQLAVNAYESYRKTQVDPSFIGPVYQPQEQRKQRSIGDQVGSMVLGGALQLLGIPGFANGGMVTSPTVALIGEGINNEAIVPLPNGRSIPVDLKGMGESSGSNSNISNAISVTIQNSGQAKETSRGDANAIASLVQNLVTQGLINERRPGGLLS